MRILYHHRTLGDGAEGIHIREMVAAFRELGHEVRVVALVGETPSRQPERETTSETAQQISSQPTDRSQQRWSGVSRWLPGVAYEIAELGYNVFAKRRLRTAVAQFQPDFIYDRYNSFSSAAVDVGRGMGVPVCLEVNAPVALERTMQSEKRRLRMDQLAIRYERSICCAADRVVAVSTPLKQFLVDERGVPADRILVLPNGADPDKFHPKCCGAEVRRSLGLVDKTVIGFLGILRNWHGIDLLIDAFGQLAKTDSSIHLLIIGDGPIQHDLEAIVADKHLENRVTFTGRVVHAAIQSHLAAMDITASPMATFYASPMKILESMAMGIPTVAANTANIRDVIEDGIDGVLFAPNDAGSLAKAIASLINQPELTAKIKHYARRKIETDRNWVSIAGEVIDSLKKVVDEDPRRR
ncbi:Alpha-D-kanosaminyltransferase [Rubripirellula lacrimiformis]|uniref:Alpha-D-kanosaminyltransferase n=1 Tax=Rubripirellula lacrimiformis TaxID=1930273 RepID=A0A517NGS8_9BACT|nr:glycosyltransferase family 4 protein [Rubripirellula lacrimiformis]QDT06273.1 Alpha-D-kanosaminyltransferase [Rubripirellula lacrimiformis]